MVNAAIQTAIEQPVRGWLPGQVPNINADGFLANLVAAGGVQQVATLTVSADASLVMTFVDPYGRTHTISVTGDGGSANNTAAAINTKINSDYRTASSVRATVSTSTVVVTALRPGEVFSISFDANVSVAATTAAASAGAVYPGRFIVPAYRAGVEIENAGRLPRAADCTAQVDTVTPVAANSKQYIVNISIDANGDGVPENYNASIFSDGSGTIAEIVAALVVKVNAVMPAATVLAAANGDTSAMLLTAEIPGVPFVTSVLDTNDGASLTVSTTTANVGPRFIGVCRQAYAMQNPLPDNQGQAQYDGGTAFPAWAGDIILECDSASSGLAAGSAIFARQAVNGSLTKLGAALSTSDSGNARPTGWIATSAVQTLQIGGEAVYLIRAMPRTNK